MAKKPRVDLDCELSGGGHPVSVHIRSASSKGESLKECLGRKPPPSVRNEEGKAGSLKMGLFSKHIETMDDLFVRGLQDIFYAEQQILNCLADMADRASDGELKRCFADHLMQTHTHLERLHQVFRMHGRDAIAIDCPAIDGIIEEVD